MKRAGVREFLGTMLARRENPYEGADLGNARRATAGILGLAGLVSAAFLPLDPPTEEIGWPGWPLAILVIAAAVAGAVLVMRKELGFDGLLAVAYAGAGGVALLTFLAGGRHAAYEDLFVLLVGAGAAHPPRRALALVGTVIALLFLPLVYIDGGEPVVRDVISEAVLIAAVGGILISSLEFIRRGRAGLTAGVEVQRRLARVDALTGLGNRRAFDEALTIELARSEREGNPIAVGLIDLDSLKRLNDRFGHLEGDRCLAAVGRETERALRRSDRCFRWGGDEFVVLLPATDRATALYVIQRAVERVEGICRDADGSPVSLSFGVAELDGDGGAEDMLAMADLALMEQKNEKRR